MGSVRIVYIPFQTFQSQMKREDKSFYFVLFLLQIRIPNARKDGDQRSPFSSHPWDTHCSGSQAALGCLPQRSDVTRKKKKKRERKRNLSLGVELQMLTFQKHSFGKIFFLVIREAVSSQVSNASAASTSTSHPSSKRRTRVSLPEASTHRSVTLPGSSQAQGSLFLLGHQREGPFMIL